MPDITKDIINGFGTIKLAPPHNEQGTLLLFLAPTCESCQHVVEHINRFLDNNLFTRKVSAFVRADASGCRVFQSLFPLQPPVGCDVILSNLVIIHGKINVKYSSEA